MIQKIKRQKRGSISEEDISTLLQRYTATTVLALLQEVAQCADVKIDWNALVKKTSTGISNAREYQMLWRHLAYRDNLLEKLENGAKPLDDDSDLEYDLEAVPAVNSEASTEAAACVKVLIASGLPSDSNLPNGATVEAPLTINVPSCRSAKVSGNSQPTSSIQGTNITVPISVQKQPHPVTTVVAAEAPDANGSSGGNIPPRRKRKPWSEAEDLQLLAAVQKFGEGNWANVIRGEFKGDRTPSQLSQRWAIIRKRYGNLNLGSTSTATQLSEAQLAARHAMSLALDMPVKSLTANSTGSAAANGTVNSAVTNATNISSVSPTAGETSMREGHKQSQQSVNPTKPFPLGSFGSTQKPRIGSKKPSIKSSFSDNLRATAVAAGARIASPSDAASLLKAAQAKNAVHIKACGSVKSTMLGGIPTHSDVHPNVHYNCTSLSATSDCSRSSVSSIVTQSVSVKASLLISHHVSTNATLLNTSSNQTNDVNHCLDQEPSKQEDDKIEEDKTVSQTGDDGNVQANGAYVAESVHNELVHETKVFSQVPEALLKNPVICVENSVISPKMKIECDQAVTEVQDKVQDKNQNVIPSSLVGVENHAVVGSSDQSANQMEEALPRAESAGCGEKMEI